MKGITGILAAAALLAVAGFVALGVASFERTMAGADESLATLRYAEAADRLAEASTHAQYTRWLPGAGGRAARDLKAREAQVHYWQQQYGAVVPGDSDPVGAVDEENVPLQIVVANSVYRAGQARATSRETAVQSLDEAIAGYATVLKGEAWDERAAYNYEYLVRLRDDLARGRRKTAPEPSSEDASLGAAGAPARTADMKKFEIYIPLEGEERNDAAEAGKGSPNKRKG